jgi:hypothetical protein
MKLPLLFLFLLALIVPPPAHSRSVNDTNCVPDTGCPKGEGPPKCCEPPECEFWNALEEARARERIHKTAQGRFILAFGLEEANQEQLDAFDKDVTDEIKKIRKKLPKCPSKSKRSPPPIFSVKGEDVDGEDKDCRIMTYIGKDKTFRQLELPDALQLSNACAELVEAKYESANVGSTYCQVEADSREDRMKEQRERATREKTYLEDQLFHYWSVCTIAPDIEVPEIITKNSVDVLKRFGFKNKWTGKPAKRAGKSGKAR